MRVFSPSFNSCFLAAAGTCALLVLVIVLITGGFIVQAGPFRVSAHHATAPLVIAALAWLGAALHGRRHLRDAASAITSFLDRHATSGALVLAASAAAAGIAFGTFSASSADPSGYISHADLLASARFAHDEPLAREVDWPDAAWSFSPLGYRPGRRPGEIVPGYPLGLPLTMVPARLIGGEPGPFLVIPLLAAVAVLSTYALGVRLHSRTTGLIAAALLTTSPILLFQVVQPMSDVPAAAWWTLALACALVPSRGAALIAGVATGLACLTRPNLLPLAGAVALAIAGWPRQGIESPGRFPSLTRLLYFALGLVPAVVALALINWRLYDSPFTTGYGDLSEFFALSNIPTNIRDYGSRLLIGESAALTLAACALAGYVATRARPVSERRKRDGVGRAAMLAALVFGLVVIIYLPYGVFPDWSYLRFFLPALPLVFVLIAALTSDATSHLPHAARGVMLFVAVTAACAFNVMRAEREQAFNLQRYEARYRAAGRYLHATLPRDAVIVTSQESGSASHYTRLPIVRWDLLTVEIDAAVQTLRERGRHPVILIEDWEMPAFRSKFHDSNIARLDWPARAEFGDEVRVLLLDPLDRDRPRSITITDRVR